MPDTDRNPAADRVDAYNPAPILRDEHSEATITRVIEQQTARIPSHWFLIAALLSMAASLGFEATRKYRWSRFVGMWVSPLLITGVYNKLVKALGPR